MIKKVPFSITDTCFLEQNILIAPGGSVVKSPPDNVGDMNSNPGLERSPGEGTDNPFQYFD